LSAGISVSSKFRATRPNLLHPAGFNPSTRQKERRMTGPEIEARLLAKGHRLPEAMPPAFQYVAVVVHGGVAYVSGQIPREGGQVMMTGKVGAEVNLAQAQRAAEACVLQALAQLKAELGDLGRIARILKVTGFVASAPGFTEQPQVIDAASGLLVHALGEAGRHARSAIGVAELPRGVPVEIELVAALI
jgi:enamine deaminase RidA (YjgF/YER057c/UK114 family)